MEPQAPQTDSMRETDPTAVLSDLGRRALPDVAHVADAHLAAITQARLAGGASLATPVGRRGRRRRAIVVGIMAASLLALPSLALAGALPDPVQRVAAQVASNVGVELPSPPKASDGDDAGDAAATSEGDDDSTDAKSTERSDSARGNDPTEGTGRPSDPGRTLPDGSPVPGKGRPAEGEQRGNRAGQGDEAPGKSGESSGRPSGSTGSSSGTPASSNGGGKPDSTPSASSGGSSNAGGGKGGGKGR